MRIYATTEDLTAWTTMAAPANAEGLLRTASVLVARDTRTAYYAVDSLGYPARSDVRQSFRDAVTAQAAFWAANDLDPAAGALQETSKRVATSKSIKGASFSYSAADATEAKRARAAAVNNLCEEAWGILDQAGLLNNPPEGY